MANADTNENISSSTDSSNAEGTKGNNALNAQLTEVQEQLRKMNAQMEATQAALAEANRKPTVPNEEEENLYDPKRLAAKMDRDFDTKLDNKLRAERAKDLMIYNLAQDYPEIQTDNKIRQAVLEAQKQIPESLRDTADGYEMAVLKAVSKAGLVPKSKRQTVDDDSSFSPRSGANSRPKARNKVSEKTLMVAQLLGRDISDETVLKGLEDAANRDNYTKYR